jgi:hypothetical protein
MRGRGIWREGGQVRDYYLADSVLCFVYIIPAHQTNQEARNGQPHHDIPHSRQTIRIDPPINQWSKDVDSAVTAGRIPHELFVGSNVAETAYEVIRPSSHP